MPVLVGLDVGTTTIKAAALDADAGASAPWRPGQRPFRTLLPDSASTTRKCFGKPSPPVCVNSSPGSRVSLSRH